MKKSTFLFAILFAAGLTSSRAQNTWVQKADFGGTARYFAVGFSIGSKGYLGTGWADNNRKDFWEYDPDANTWTQKADYGGAARVGAVGFSIGSKGYVGCGLEQLVAYHNDVWEYDPETNSWVQKAHFPGEVRHGAVSFSIDGKGYVGTGTNTGQFFKDFWEFDPVADTWTKKADFGGDGRNAGIGFSIGSKGYIGTGTSGGYYIGSKPVHYKDFWEYDPSTDTWTQKADFVGLKRYGCVGLSIGNKGYIGAGANYTTYANDFWEYDPFTNTWKKKADFGGNANVYAIGFSIGCKGYVGTGYDGSTLLQDFWEYTGNGSTVFADADGDSYGNAANSLFVAGCIVPDGYVLDSTDCNDGNATIHPAACDAYNGNGIDDNCDGLIDDGFGTAIYFIDADGDGYGTGSGTSLCSNPGAGYTINNNTDCNDADAFVNPGASELVNGIDDNCDGIIDINCWTQKADFGGTARYGAVGFSIDNKGYIGTGINAGKDFWEYNPSINAWAQKADFGGTARYGAVGFSIGSKGYIGIGSYNYDFYKDFWEYDPATNVWTKKANFGGTARDWAVGFSIGNKGYLGTGKPSSYGWPSYSDFWEYDPALNSWTQKADFGGTARWGAVGFSNGSKGYLGTGYDSGSYFTKDFWEYDPDANTWTQKADFGGTARYGAVGFSIASKGYLGTGYDGIYPDNYTKDFWEYDSVLDKWTQKADLEGAVRFSAVGFSIASKGYLGTGSEGFSNVYKDFWEYTVDSSSCTIPKAKITPLGNLDICTAGFVKLIAKSGDDYHYQWNRNGTDIPGATNQVYYAKKTGDFRVNVFKEIECSAVSKKVTVYTSCKLDEDASDEFTSEMKLYPNPTNGQFVIAITLPDGVNTLATLQVINTLGQIVYDETTSVMNGMLQKEIQLNDAADGMYLVKVIINDQVYSNQISFQK